jgi:hypothetical protein
MTEPNLTHWPRHAPRHLPLPDTSLWYNIEVSAVRYPHKTAIVFYDTLLSYLELKRSAELLARHTIIACYSDYLTAPTDLSVPDFLKAPTVSSAGPATTPWANVLAMNLEPDPHVAIPMICASCPTPPAPRVSPRDASTDIEA